MSAAYAMPRWYAGAQVADQQHTPSGEVWTVMSIEAGGRVIHWEALDGRKGRSEATPDHPEYPTDEQVLEAARAAKRAARNKPVVWP